MLYFKLVCFVSIYFSNHLVIDGIKISRSHGRRERGSHPCPLKHRVTPISWGKAKAVSTINDFCYEQRAKGTQILASLPTYTQFHSNSTKVLKYFLHPGGACARALHIAAGNFREAWEWLHQNGHIFYSSSSTPLSVHRIKANIYKQISN